MNIKSTKVLIYLPLNAGQKGFSCLIWYLLGVRGNRYIVTVNLCYVAVKQPLAEFGKVCFCCAAGTAYQPVYLCAVLQIIGKAAVYYVIYVYLGAHADKRTLPKFRSPQGDNGQSGIVVSRFHFTDCGGNAHNHPIWLHFAFGLQAAYVAVFALEFDITIGGVQRSMDGLFLGNLPEPYTRAKVPSVLIPQRGKLGQFEQVYMIVCPIQERCAMNKPIISRIFDNLIRLCAQLFHDAGLLEGDAIAKAVSASLGIKPTEEVARHLHVRYGFVRYLHAACGKYGPGKIYDGSILLCIVLIRCNGNVILCACPMLFYNLLDKFSNLSILGRYIILICKHSPPHKAYNPGFSWSLSRFLSIVCAM